METKHVTHLFALKARLSNERNYLANEKSSLGKALRETWILQTEKEIADEYRFLGIPAIFECEMTDDELMAALS